MRKPLENILEHRPKDKFISLCPWCDCPNFETDENSRWDKPFTKKWKSKGYSTSHGMCERKKHGSILKSNNKIVCQKLNIDNQ